MAPKGSPRDMDKWRETLRDPNIKFPGESSEYRRARNQLLAAEDELRRLNEQVAAQRRALPAGGLIGEDYIFESAADGSEVRFSELFAPGKDTLVIYHMMFPRWSKDPRAGAAGGKTALLPQPRSWPRSLTIRSSMSKRDRFGISVSGKNRATVSQTVAAFVIFSRSSSSSMSSRSRTLRAASTFTASRWSAGVATTCRKG